MAKSSLVVLSLPYQRLIRTHLSRQIINILLPRADIVILSPFALNEQFKAAYNQNGISHLFFLDLAEKNKIYWFFSLVIRVLRVHGYYYKNFKSMSYYLKNRYKKFSDNGLDVEANIITKFIIFTLGFVGIYSQVWKLFNFILANFDKKNLKALSDVARKYSDVILLQGASWGNQDRFAAFAAERFSWRTVFLPYTTDQLYSNGYLYTDYDAICIKGSQEMEFINKFHRSALKNKIYLTGNLQNRIYDELIKDVSNKKFLRKSLHLKIMFAGTTSKNVPTESEFEALDCLLASRSSETMIVYRAFMQSEEHKKIIEKKYKNNRNFEIQYVSESLTGLSKFYGDVTDEMLLNYLEDLMNVDILITVGPTSLTLDAAYLGAPTIAYWGDSTGVLEKRYTSLLFDENKCRTRDIFSEVPVAHDCIQLLEILERYSKSLDLRKADATKIIKSWDNKETSFSKMFSYAVFGEDI